MNIGKSRKGQGIIGLIYADIVFFVLWGLWLGGWLKDVGQQGIVNLGLTGYEAMILGNLNWVVFMGVVLVNIATFAFAGGK